MLIFQGVFSGQLHVGNCLAAPWSVHLVLLGHVAHVFFEILGQSCDQKLCRNRDIYPNANLADEISIKLSLLPSDFKQTTTQKRHQGNGRFLGEPAPTIIIPRLGSRENDENKPMERPVPQMVQVFKHGILTVPL